MRKGNKVLILTIAIALIFNAAITANADQLVEMLDNEASQTTSAMVSGNEEAPRNILVYEDAVERALSYNHALKNLEGQLKKLEDARSRITLYDYPSSQGNGEEDSQRLSQLKNAINLDINIQMTKKNIETTKESISFEVRNSMNEIYRLLNEKNLNALKLESDKLSLEMANVKAALGLISGYELENEQSIYNKSVTDMELQDKSLENAYINLGDLIGARQIDQYDIEESIKYEPLTDKNVSHLVNRGISSSPTIWNQEKKIELAQLDLTLYVFNAGGDSYSAKEIDLQMEKTNLASQKSSLEHTIRTLYNQIERLEKNLEILEENLKSAERDKARVEIQYDLGLAIKVQLKKAELNEAQVRNDIINNQMEHEKLKTRLYKPHLTSQT